MNNTKRLSVTEFLGLLNKGRRSGSEWSALCPAHDDKQPSLTVRQGNDGRILVHCHAGCDLETILARLGLEERQLFTEALESPTSEFPKKSGEPEAVYTYRDDAGRPTYQVCRFPGKGFGIRRLAGDGGYEWGLGEHRRILYRLPELIAASPDEPVLVVEGEKDADRAAADGFVATTNVSGAHSKWLADYSESLRGRDVVIVPDNDQPGRRHALDIGGKLEGLARTVRVLELPGVPEKGDVSDFLDLGGTPEDLQRLIAEAPSFTDWQAKISPTESVLGKGRADDYGSLVKLWEMAEPEPMPWLWEGLIPENLVTALYGDGGVGKSTLALGLATHVALGRPFLNREVRQGNVLWLDAEQDKQIVRLQAGRIAKGLGLASPPEGLYYLFLPGCLSNDEVIARVHAAIGEAEPSLIVIDSMTVASPDIDPKEPSGIASLMKTLKTLGTVLTLDHVAKTKTSGGSVRQYGTVFKGNLSRSTILVEELDGLLLLSHTKTNYSRKQPTMAVQVTHNGEDSIVFSSISGELTLAKVTAKAAILEILAEGPLQKAEVLRHPGLAGWKEKTLENAIGKLLKYGEVVRANGVLTVKNASEENGEAITENNEPVEGEL